MSPSATPQVSDLDLPFFDVVSDTYETDPHAVLDELPHDELGRALAARFLCACLRTGQGPQAQRRHRPHLRRHGPEPESDAGQDGRRVHVEPARPSADPAAAPRTASDATPSIAASATSPRSCTVSSTR